MILFGCFKINELNFSPYFPHLTSIYTHEWSSGPWPSSHYLSTPHKHLYLWSDHQVKGMWWLFLVNLESIQVLRFFLSSFFFLPCSNKKVFNFFFWRNKHTHTWLSRNVSQISYGPVLMFNSQLKHCQST